MGKTPGVTGAGNQTRSTNKIKIKPTKRGKSKVGRKTPMGHKGKKRTQESKKKGKERKGSKGKNKKPE